MTCKWEIPAGRTERNGTMTRKAFTLIELLVVIAIIALLMAILMPVLGKVRKQGRAVACKAHLHQWGLVFSMYSGDNEGRFPDGFSVDTGKGYYLWMDRMASFYQDERMFTCPTATRLLEKGRGIGVGRGGAYYAWGGIDPVGKEYVGSYGQNYWVGDETEGTSRHAAENYFTKIDVKHTSIIPAVADCLWIGGYPHHTDPPPSYMDALTGGQMARFCLDRHEGYINMAFLDCSVRKVGLKEMWAFKWHRTYELNNVWTSAGGVEHSDWPEWMTSFKDY